ncbi:MAG: prephenate dehydrogenase/arogenate dehydrogenase family protein, partial [Leptospiraceae bacterium]|nr:prephenate dehydrogenase/arogenate dehydrogenase family protein [Leptospiraceae bacterium]
MFRSVLIYGFGLMGASLSRAIRKKQLANQITAIVRNQASLEELKKLNFQDTFITEESFLSQNVWNEYDLIVFCLPVDTIVKKIFFIPESYQGIITDLGSTKKIIIEAVEKKFPNYHNYISSHPMTGSENSGAEFAKEGLYENKVCILTCPKNYRTESLEKLKKFWISLN